ncbi:hypothetical protein [Pelagibacterium montanilacus]|uniref:hypothetical protein n=1 Tax=Pelagibacterium montanilacus TaxID=2185280 RepID=UPI001FE8AB6B|nr:hypothetical protein [Pelagibacterium montanilacus]
MAAIGRTLVRECSAAVAVLAVYVLTLLVPLHQAQATQDAFEVLGFEPLSGWSLCLAGETESPSPGGPQPVCPVAGVGKTGMALPDLVAIPGPLAVVLRIGQPVLALAPIAPAPHGTPPARAPPETP